MQPKGAGEIPETVRATSSPGGGGGGHEVEDFVPVYPPTWLHDALKQLLAPK